MNRLSGLFLPTLVCSLLLAGTVRAQFPDERTYNIDAVTVTAGGEDRAYGIMRRAIAAAPYYLHQVSEYSAEVYLKGSFDMVKISKLVRGLAGERFDFKEGENYMQESVNEITFTAPDKYEQRVIKQMSSMPKGSREIEEQAMRLVNINIYDPAALPFIISPLSSGAFSHYRFRYEGYVEERGRIINKIKVIPVHKGQQLVSGHILIAEDHWNVHGLDLSGHISMVAGIDFNLQTDYGEMAENVWIPVGHRITFDLGLMGTKGTMRYVASVDYGRVVENGELRVSELPFPGVSDALSDVSSGATRKKFSNRDAYRAARRATKEIEAPRHRSLDVTEEFTDNFKVTFDTLAREPDPEFWDRVRPIALEPAELKGYNDRGILPPARPDTTAAAAIRRRRKTIAAKMLFGGSPLKLGKKGGELVWRGVIPTKSGFNTVDGFYVGIWPVDYRKTFGPSANTTLTVSPQVGWAINRHVMLADLEARLEYAPLSRGEFKLHAGSVSRDFTAVGSGILPFDNTIASLVFRRGYLKLYGETFVEAGNTIDIANGLAVSLSAKYSRREGLENTSDYSFFYRKEREFTPNISIPDHTAAIFTLGVEYTPRHYYRIRENGRKQMVRSDWPTFFVGWKKGVSGIGGSTTDFDHISGGVRQNIALGNPMHRLEYFVYGGVFTNKKSLYFPDFRHFDAADIPVTNSSITSVGSYRMLESYLHSTPDRYLEVHVSYRARVLLLKLLPWFNGRLWQEGVQFHYLDTPALKNHMEIDYTVGLVWQAGFFVGLDNFKYRRAGFKFSLPLRIFLNRR